MLVTGLSCALLCSWPSDLSFLVPFPPPPTPLDWDLETLRWHRRRPRRRSQGGAEKGGEFPSESGEENTQKYPLEKANQTRKPLFCHHSFLPSAVLMHLLPGLFSEEGNTARTFGEEEEGRAMALRSAGRIYLRRRGAGEGLIPMERQTKRTRN